MLYCCTKMTNVPDLELRYLCAMYMYNNTNRTNSKTKKTKTKKTSFYSKKNPQTSNVNH